MSRPSKDPTQADLSKQRFQTLQPLITHHCAGNTQLSNPLTTAISKLPNYFSEEDSQKFADFTTILLTQDNPEFYQKLSEIFSSQKDKRNIEFLLISCFLRDFLTAKIPRDLEFVVTYAGFTPQVIVKFHESNNEEKKDGFKYDFLQEISRRERFAELIQRKDIDELSKREMIGELLLELLPHNLAVMVLEYLPDEELIKITENLIKFSDKDAIVAKSTTFLKCSRLENIAEFDLATLQGIVVQEITNLNGIANPAVEETKDPMVFHPRENPLFPVFPEPNPQQQETVRFTEQRTPEKLTRKRPSIVMRGRSERLSGEGEIVPESPTSPLAKTAKSTFSTPTDGSSEKKDDSDYSQDSPGTSPSKKLSEPFKNLQLINNNKSSQSHQT